jgi:putative colanic acid biosynthesis acetyltransferase WcaF
MTSSNDATMATGRVKLSEFENTWYKPGRSRLTCAAWMAVNRAFFQSTVPWPYGLKRFLLRAFGATVGAGVVIKNRVNIKYPWHISIGDHSWIGEGAWIDSLGDVNIGTNACLSQGCMIETGNHDWAKRTFDLFLEPVVVEDGAWAAVRSTLLPGSRLASHAILGAGSVLRGATEPYAVYVGVPAAKVARRTVSP